MQLVESEQDLGCLTPGSISQPTLPQTEREKVCCSSRIWKDSVLHASPGVQLPVTPKAELPKTLVLSAVLGKLDITAGSRLLPGAKLTEGSSMVWKL